MVSEHDISNFGKIWPQYLIDGLLLFYDGMSIPIEEVNAFIHRWSTLTAEQKEKLKQISQEGYTMDISPEKLDAYVPLLDSLQNEEVYLRALTEGMAPDRELAICILGKSNFPQAREAVLPFLASTEPKERWLSALVLGERGEVSAFSTLTTMLTEFFPQKSRGIVVEQQWFNQYRGYALRLLELASIPSFIPIVRHAFIESIEAETTVFNTHIQYTPIEKECLQRWYQYQDALARVLGRKEAFGALTGQHIPPEHLYIALINMALGYCNIEEFLQVAGPPYDWQADKTFSTKVKIVLEQRFGLLELEQQKAFELYRENHFSQNRLRDR